MTSPWHPAAADPPDTGRYVLARWSDWGNPFCAPAFWLPGIGWSSDVGTDPIEWCELPAPPDTAEAAALDARWRDFLADGGAGTEAGTETP